MKQIAIAMSGFFLGVTFLAPRAGGQDFSKLLKYVPGPTNAIVLIDGESIMATKMAKETGWAARRAAAFAKRPIFIPPETKKLVLASSIKANQGMDQRWEIGVAQLDQPIPMRSIARAEGGYVDMINDEAAAWSPSGAYFVSLEPSLMGVVFPADRQFTARWMGYARGDNLGQLSPYLKAVTRGVTDRVQYVMALDLENAIQPHRLDEGMRDSEYLDDSADINAIAEVITSIRGMMLRVAFGDTAQAQLRLDFGVDVAPIAAKAKEMILHVLSEQGAEIGDMENWKLEAKGKTVTLRGELTESGLRRLFSVIEMPSTNFSSLKDEQAKIAEGGDGPTESEIIASSQAYFGSVATLIEDLRRDFRDTSKRRNVSAWMERYARKIDRLPILHVDEELLAYGGTIADTFRDMGLSRRQAGIRAGAEIAGSYGRNFSTHTNGFFDGYGRGWRDTGSSLNRARIKQQQMAQANQVRVQGWSDIDGLTADVRKKMTQKYKVEFDIRPRRTAAAG